MLDSQQRLAVPGVRTLGVVNTKVQSRAGVTEKIALYKLNMTVESVYENGKMAVSSIHEEIPANTFLKVPQCVSSVCHVTPFHFTYGVYKDLAEKFENTVGQIMAFNGGYNYSESASDADSAWISVTMGCINLALNVTEEI